MTEILYGLRGAQRERVAALRETKRFFWLDVSLSETSLDDLAETLNIPERASRALTRLRVADGPLRTFYTDGAHLVFARPATSSVRGQHPEPNGCSPSMSSFSSAASTC